VVLDHLVNIEARRLGLFSLMLDGLVDDRDPTLQDGLHNGTLCTLQYRPYRRMSVE
jgi:hypothetical protein